MESVVANSLETEGIIENCLPMTGGVGHKNITDGGGVVGVINITDPWGGRESGKYFHDTTKILQSASPSPPSPTIINDRVLNCQRYHQIFFHRLM